MTEQLGTPINELLVIYPLIDSAIKKSSLISLHFELRSTVIRLKGYFTSIRERVIEPKGLLKQKTVVPCIQLQVLPDEQLAHLQLIHLVQKPLKVYFVQFNQIYYFFSRIVEANRHEDITFIDIMFPSLVTERKRRIATRIQLEKPPAAAMWIENISLSGLLLKSESAFPLEVADICHLFLKFPSDPDQTKTEFSEETPIKIRLVWKDIHQVQAMGFEFLDIPKEALSAIQRYIVKIKKKTMPYPYITVIKCINSKDLVK